MRLFNWIINNIFRVIFYLKRILTVNLPVNEKTNLIDGNKVKNVCLHYDGETYYVTAIVEGNLIFIKHSPNLENWFKASGLPISRLCDIWEMKIPEKTNVFDCKNIPQSTLRSALNI